MSHRYQPVRSSGSCPIDPAVDSGAAHEDSPAFIERVEAAVDVMRGMIGCAVMLWLVLVTSVALVVGLEIVLLLAARIMQFLTWSGQ